ncbi:MULTISPECIES: ligase-associated DNA damage response endonuclease PdeM [Hyphomonas]|nr:MULTISPECIES: ligase-associated DNA damage response endonuclease PdeM [Hyphomonas]MBB41318.1 phosphoesterase [Hyphomonas sp.]|tara:strand:+ start:1010 stop:1735 length:726 start_codon:yes stop_codon:yes gene_type:complete
MTAALANRREETFLHLAGELLVPLPEGGLWWPEQRLLVVSDLHLEKGSAYAARGQMLPPYDTGATLAVVERLSAQLMPQTIISLGDSFHDRAAELRLPEPYADRIHALTSAHDWIWVEGNHDPDPPAHLGGRAEKSVRLGPLVFRHEPEGEAGEVSGHLHPVAKVKGRGRNVRRRCFASDGARLVMPALGAFTGGLNVLDEAFTKVFPEGLTAFALGEGKVFVLSGGSLLGDVPRGAPWKL